jgi:hypothetical protein
MTYSEAEALRVSVQECNPHTQFAVVEFDSLDCVGVGAICGRASDSGRMTCDFSRADNGQPGYPVLSPPTTGTPGTLWGVIMSGGRVPNGMVLVGSALGEFCGEPLRWENDLPDPRQ